MGAIAPPPIPKVAPKIFRSIKLLTSKPKKYFSANHRKCLRNLLHNLVEPGQSTVVQQLSMINQTLCTRGGNNSIFQVKPSIFVEWAKMVKFHFFHSKLRKQPFLLKIIGKCRILKAGRGKGLLLALPSRRPWLCI